MIDEKKIEEVAQRYCNVTDASKNEASLLSEGFKEGAYWMMGEFLKENMFYKAKDKRIQDILELGYARITNEFLESLWHDASEEPEKGENCIVRVRYKYANYLGDDDYEEYSTAVYLGGTSWSEDHFSSEANVYILRWCRISDILPTKGGEG